MHSHDSAVIYTVTRKHKIPKNQSKSSPKNYINKKSEIRDQVKKIREERQRLERGAQKWVILLPQQEE